MLTRISVHSLDEDEEQETRRSRAEDAAKVGFVDAAGGGVAQ